jgi:hypothetical protein
MVKIMASNMYALEGYNRVWKPGKGYVDVSTAYPGGVPESMGHGWGGAVEIARIARGTHHLQEYLTPGEIAYAQELHDPRNTPLGHAPGVSSFTYPQIIPAEFTTGSPATRAAMSSDYEARVTGTSASRSASTGVAGGGTALARGGPAVGVAPGAGLNLTGVGSSITSAGNSAISMVTPYIPLATKVVLGVIALKIVLWLIRGKK